MNLLILDNNYYMCMYFLLSINVNEYKNIYKCIH